MNNIKVAIFEDNHSLRNGLYQLIDGSEGYECVGAYPDCDDLLKEFRYRRAAPPALPGQVHAVQRLVRSKPAQRARAHRQGDPGLHTGAHRRPRWRPERSAAAGIQPDP